MNVRSRRSEFGFYLLSFLITGVFFSVVSPLGDDGRVLTGNIMLAAILLMVTIFSFVRVCLMALTKLNSKMSIGISAVVSATTVEILLISSLELLTPVVFVAIIVFNLLSVWYLRKRFRAN